MTTNAAAANRFAGTHLAGGRSMRTTNGPSSVWMLPLAVLMLAATPTLLHSAPSPATTSVQHNLVSDLPGLARHRSRPGKSVGNFLFAGSPFWVSRQRHRHWPRSTTTFGVKQGLVVSIPPPGGGTSAHLPVRSSTATPRISAVPTSSFPPRTEPSRRGRGQLMRRW